MNMDRSVAVGVEITGKRATVALVDRHGHIRRRCQAKTLWGRPANATLEPYVRAIDTLLAEAQTEGWSVCGMGISIPGTLDQTSRNPLLIPSLPSLNGFPLCDLLEARYGLPTRLSVDVDAALVGEYGFGGGEGARRLLFLTVDAVVGAAMIIEGKIEQTARQYVGHVCHVSVAATGPRCSCGKRGCINTLVSLDAMQKMVQRAVRRGEETSLTQRLLNREDFSPQLLAEEAGRGDSVALQIYSEVGRWLGAAVTHYVSIFGPDMLILGGGILSAGDLLLSQMRSALLSSPQGRSMVEIVPARLGSDAALIGAAAACFPVRIPRGVIRRSDVVPPSQRSHSASLPLPADDANPVALDVIEGVIDASNSWLAG